ncbi:MAG: hypothetical protein WBZ36_01875 [Candidatus Nitrosopolaris sp.]
MPRILGWDAAGEVIAACSDCTLFQKGDAVYYAGSISRQGTNCEFHLVDWITVGIAMTGDIIRTSNRTIRHLP